MKNEEFLERLKEKNITLDRIKELNQVALEVRNNAYVPYSNFSVGAALLTSDDKILSGMNIENASFSPGSCAERTVIYKAISEGNRDFVAISICGGRGGEAPTSLCPPCGVCRQVMREFVNKYEFLIILCKSKDEFEAYTLEELLPMSFGPEFI